MEIENPAAYALAVMDFRRARRRAGMRQILRRSVGGRGTLLSYEDVRNKLRAREIPGWKLEEIPLDSIVGSVGRYQDFTRDFLPLEPADESRWARVKVAMEGAAGLPPIDVYRIGGVHFVLDGNHRVSVARQLGASQIQAFVKEVEAKVPLTPEMDLDDLLIKAEQAEFIERTQLDVTRPGADLTVTAPGRYEVLEARIESHRLRMPHPTGEVSQPAAAVSWFDRDYLPTVHSIRRISLLREFPERTETDLYVWITQHRAELERTLGWEVAAESAAVDLLARAGRGFRRWIGRLTEQLIGVLTRRRWIPTAGPPRWPEGRLAAQERDGFSPSILLPIGGPGRDWNALDQAVVVAQREGARLLGLFVLRSDSPQQREIARQTLAEFERRCAEIGIEGEAGLEVGPIAPTICDRARWADLVILRLTYPPGPRPLARLRSGAHTILQQCPRPVLVVPGSATPLKRALLAFDGSTKAEEALYLATYLAGRWNIGLVILTVVQGEGVGAATLERAAEYARDHELTPILELKSGAVDELILATAREHGCDLILMGGYGLSPLLEFALGSAVDQVLRRSEVPVLICR